MLSRWGHLRDRCWGLAFPRPCAVSRIGCAARLPSAPSTLAGQSGWLRDAGRSQQASTANCGDRQVFRLDLQKLRKPVPREAPHLLPVPVARPTSPGNNQTEPTCEQPRIWFWFQALSWLTMTQAGPSAPHFPPVHQKLSSDS